MSFRLQSSTLDFWVEVRLRSFGDRWIAVADIGGEPELGLAGSARGALVASLSSLGPSAVESLMAAPQLLGIDHPIVN